MQDSQNLSDQPSVSANGISAAAQNAASQGQSSSQSAPAGQSEAKAGATSERRSADASAASSSNSTRPIPAGLDRQIHVFTRDAVAAAEASGRYAEFAYLLQESILHLTLLELVTHAVLGRCVHQCCKCSADYKYVNQWAQSH